MIEEIGKNELAKYIASSNPVTQAEAKNIITSLINCIEAELIKGNKINIKGFMTIEVIDKPERIGRNPYSGVAIKVPAKRVVKSKISKRLNDLVNQ